jgi:hypothetical protein
VQAGIASAAGAALLDELEVELPALVEVAVEVCSDEHAPSKNTKVDVVRIDRSISVPPSAK